MKHTLFIVIDADIVEDIDPAERLTVAELPSNVVEYVAAQLCEDQDGPYVLLNPTVYGDVDDLLADLSENRLTIYKGST